jgi:broad specificity phosphatase PhoE
VPTSGDPALALIERFAGEGIEHAAVLMRHSAREFSPDVHDLVNPLTDEGRQLCLRFGAALPPGFTLRGYASPAARCMETAALILEGQRDRGGRVTRHRPVEALGVFYALDQMKMWRGMHAIGGMTAYLEAWFAGGVPRDAMMPADLAARLVLEVVVGKLAAQPAPAQLDLCVTHDMTIALVRDQLLGEPVAGPEVQFLDALIAFRRDGRLWLASHHGEPRDVTGLVAAA